MSEQKSYFDMRIQGNLQVSGNLMSILNVDSVANVHFPNEASLRMYSNPIGLRQYASCNVNSGGTFTNNYGISGVSRTGSIYTISYNPIFPTIPAISTTIFGSTPSLFGFSSVVLDANGSYANVLTYQIVLGVPTATTANFYFTASI